MQPQIPVTNYRYLCALDYVGFLGDTVENWFTDPSNIHANIFRYEVTGITEAHLRDAMPLKEVREKVTEILQNGESIGRLRLDGGKGRLLVGHDLCHKLDCLRMYYPDHLLR